MRSNELGANELGANELGNEGLSFDPRDYPAHSPPKPRGGLMAGLARLGFALGALALVGGSVYLGLRHSATLVDDGGLPLVKADPRPIKSRPNQPGGMEVRDQDKLVFDRLAPDSAPPKVERLLPPPETPLLRPVAPPPQLVRDDSKTGALRTLPERFLQPPAVPTVTIVTPVPTVPPVPPVTPVPPVPLVPTVSAVPAPTQALPKLAAIPPAVTSVPVALTTKTPAPAPVGDVTRIQLGSVRTEVEAKSEWTRLQGRHRDLLGALSPVVKRADLGERGVYYRLQAGPLDEVRARDVCAQLQILKVGCQLVKR
ncbi:MAG: SPOR domain-containing protein [Rhodospirillaceae bacterium]